MFNAASSSATAACTPPREEIAAVTAVDSRDLFRNLRRVVCCDMMAVLRFFWLVASNISTEKGVRNQISPPEPLQATGIDDSAIEKSQCARSARRSAQDSKPCVSSATGCDDDAFKPPAKKAPKPLCIADLGDTVQASATDCENSGGGI